MQQDAVAVTAQGKRIENFYDVTHLKVVGFHG